MYSYQERVRAVELYLQLGGAKQGDHSPVGLFDEEFSEGVV